LPRSHDHAYTAAMMLPATETTMNEPVRPAMTIGTPSSRWRRGLKRSQP
jgi:hypothetical protein